MKIYDIHTKRPPFGKPILVWYHFKGVPNSGEWKIAILERLPISDTCSRRYWLNQYGREAWAMYPSSRSDTTIVTHFMFLPKAP